ncbi:MAG: phycobiliprotein lyase [Cyanobacteria bacterium P01_D01_bin.105]
MEIVNFFEKLAGRWFSQRTTHALSTQQSKAGKSDLEVTFLAADAPEVGQLCQSQGPLQGATAPLCGLSIHQSSTVEGDTKAKVMTTLLVPLTPENAGNGAFSGKLLRSGTADVSTYTLEDDVLTIIGDGNEAHSEERLWFINENLRMRTGMTELKSGPQTGLRIASFCSEIRLGVKPPKDA